jgi:hypothetical protein
MASIAAALDQIKHTPPEADSILDTHAVEPIGKDMNCFGTPSRGCWNW